MTNIDSLVHGKSGIKRVVGLEVTDGSAELFIQNEAGKIESQFIQNRYWILAHTNIDGSFSKLDGDLFYCWGKQFTDHRQWCKMRSIWRDRDIYSCWNPEEALMIKDGITFYQDLKLKDISLISWDIETTGLDGYADDAKVLLISTTYRDQYGQVNKLFSFDEYKSEGELIEAFGEYIQKMNPSLLVGFNILGYDFPYMEARAKLNNVKLAWGRDGSNVEFENYESKFRLDGTRDLLYKRVKVYGREIVDAFLLAISYDVSKSIESYALKPMIKQLGLEKEGREYYDAASIRKNYKNPIELKKIKQYAIDDAEDSVKVWDLMGSLYFNMAQMFPKPFTEILLSASGSKINGMMCRAYLQDRHSIPKANAAIKYKGALSWGRPGIYKNVKKVDAVSLYPSIIIQYEVYDNLKDPKAYLLELVKIFRSKRLEYKKLAADTGDSYWKEMDITAKGVLNSFYGFYGCPGLNFNSYECADFITAKGREILETAIVWATSKKLEEIAPDYYEDDTGEEVC